MAGGMSAQVAVERLPASVLRYALIAAFQAGKHSGIISEAVYQTAHLYRGHPRRIALQIITHTARKQPHVLKVESISLHITFHFHSKPSFVLPGINRLPGNTERGNPCQQTDQISFKLHKHSIFHSQHNTTIPTPPLNHKYLRKKSTYKLIYVQFYFEISQ